jgi:DNA-binding transcriptional ArsR family regulator
MPTPMMRMGLVGFQPKDDDYLCKLLKTRSVSLQWERWPFVEADALWINGAKAEPAKDGLVRVPSPDPLRPDTLLDLRELERPMAFAGPIGNRKLQAPVVFDPHNAASVDQVLRVYEGILRPLALQLTLGRCLADRLDKLASPTYHLMLRGSMVGVVNIGGSVGISAGLLPAELASAEWASRPSAAGAFPDNFLRTNFGELMWQFTMRTPTELLPDKYRQFPIYFRHVPVVSQRLVKDTHLSIVAELTRGPQTASQLQDNIGVSERAMVQALTALYMAGSITTDPRRAAPASRSAPEPESQPPGLAQSLLDSDAGFQGADAQATVPTPLEIHAEEQAGHRPS